MIHDKAPLPIHAPRNFRDGTMRENVDLLLGDNDTGDKKNVKRSMIEKREKIDDYF